MQSWVTKSQSNSRSHYSVALYSCSFGERNIVQTVLFYALFEFLFLTLLWAHFNSRQLGLKFTLSRAHDMCMPASVNPVVLTPLRRKWGPTVLKSKKRYPLIARYCIWGKPNSCILASRSVSSNFNLNSTSIATRIQTINPVIYQVIWWRNLEDWEEKF